MEKNYIVEIKKMTRHDLSILGKMFATTFGGEVHPDYIRQRIKRIRQFYHLLRPVAPFSPRIKNLFNIYIIKVNGSPAGFMQVSCINRTQLHLDYIAVNKQYRGLGLGTWALRTLITKASEQGNAAIALEVKSDSPAYHLYKRLGFRIQSRILHYEKNLSDMKLISTPSAITGFSEVKDAYRAQLYELYRHSVPENVQQAMPREYSHYAPSLFIRHLDWLKRWSMRSKKKEYVIKRDGILAASLEILSYPTVSQHVLNVMIHQQYPELRSSLLKYALSYLHKKYRHGRVCTTIYDDDSVKYKTLERLGFTRTATYYLMLRRSHAPGVPIAQPRILSGKIPLYQDSRQQHSNLRSEKR